VALRWGLVTARTVDALGHLLALKITPTNEQDRDQVGELTEAAQKATGENEEVAFVDQGHTGEKPAGQAAAHAVRLEVVKTTIREYFIPDFSNWKDHDAFESSFARLLKDLRGKATPPAPAQS
jgi:hypothetical protein